MREELAGDYEDLKEVAKIMKEYSEDTSNLIYYNKKAMEESMRKTDLKFAKEEGVYLKDIMKVMQKVLMKAMQKELQKV